MAGFFSTYPYMALSLVLLSVFGFAFLVCPLHCRKSLFLSALISAPYGFASVFFVPEYWDPVRVFEISAGPEDIVFSFANGGTAWLFGIWVLRDRVRMEFRTKRIISHAVGYVSFGYACFVFFRSMDLGAMISATYSICALGTVVLAIRRDLWPLALAGSLTFGLFYFVVIKVCFQIFPEFLLQWNHANLWGPAAFGVPLDEIVWAGVFGGVWPMMMALAFDARFSPGKNTSKQAPGNCSGNSAVDL